MSSASSEHLRNSFQADAPRSAPTSHEAGSVSRALGLSYVVAKDPNDSNAIWITEVWDTPASHRASLSLPTVQQAIARAKPLITGFGERFETEPVGGHGLAPATH